MSRKRGTIFIDFDGTIVQNKFPRIGKPQPNAFEVMKELQEAGYKLVLWTCREDFPRIDKRFLQEAVDFCKENGLEFDGVNECLPDDEFRPDNVKKRKPNCQWFIDDKNLGGFPGWAVVRKRLLED